MVKPLTQVMFKTQSKGLLVDSADQLAARFADFRRQPLGSQLLNLDPAAALPMVQREFVRPTVRSATGKQLRERL